MPQVVNMLKRRGLGNRKAREGAAITMCEAPVKTEDIPDGIEGPMADFGAIGDVGLSDSKWAYSYGGFMIRGLWAQQGTGDYRDPDRLLTPSFNADSAVTIFRAQGWRPWSTYTSGMYKAYLQDLFPPPANTYIVLANESLSTIAPKLAGAPWNTKITWQELARINGIKESDDYRIFIGQPLLYKVVA